MNAFLGQLGQKLAERWLTLLVLPGALYLVAAACARALGQHHLAAPGRISAQITGWSKSSSVTTTAGQVVLLASLLAAAAAAGLAAQALGAAVERAALAADWHSWPSPAHWLADKRARVRRDRWDAAHAEYSRLYRAAAPDAGSVSGEDLDRRTRARSERTRVALERPERPTWSGDRINAAAVRVRRDLQLELGVAWPYLWLSMSDTIRNQISEARQSLARATVLGGWAMLYAALAWWWWPALPLSAALGVVSRHRIRDAADAYATLLEAAARLHVDGLARSLGIPDGADRPVGPELMSRLRSLPPLAKDAEAPTPGA